MPCLATGCKKRNSFGLPGEKPQFCAEHKKEGMVNLKCKHCEFEGCKRVDPCFGVLGGKGQFCAEHKKEGMVDVVHKRCGYTGCQSLEPGFGPVGGKPQFCAKHKTADMVYLKGGKCGFSGCKIQPIFGYKNSNVRFCATHKKEDMVDLYSKLCQAEGCKKRPNYGMEWRKPTHCKQHKATHMEDVMTIRCQMEGCKVLNPNFGPKGGLARWCAIHKTADMVNVKSKKCEHPACDKPSPAYDFPGKSKTGRFCVLHKEPGMIDIRNIRCDTGCGTLATFGPEGGVKTRCKKHKEPGMVDVSHALLCERDGCTKRPNFNRPGELAGRFCLLHKEPNMVDVKSPQCTTDGCTVRPLYGTPGMSTTRCYRHREKGMIRRPNGKCLVCKEPAIWGTNWTPTHCDRHHVEDQQNLVERECSSCGLTCILDSDNMCEWCHPESWAVARLAKQNGLMEYLDQRGLRGSSTDKIVEGGACGLERPDRVYELEDKIVIVECDEDQHRRIACECEQVRMINIGQSFGGTPVYFIRWNPDNYSPLSDAVPDSVSKRHALCGDLLDDIHRERVTLPKALVSVIYLFYDGWDSLAKEEWKVLF